MFRGLWAIIYKEILQVRRDPATRFVFLIPVIQTIIFGFAIDMDIQHIRAVVFDMEQSRESRRLVERFANTGTFDIVGHAGGEQAIARRDRGGAREGGNHRAARLWREAAARRAGDRAGAGGRQR